MPKIIIKAGRNKGAEFTIVSPRMVMGRRSHCDIQILESKSSREHVEILFDGQEMYIRDLNSRNGTRLNGAPISTKQPLRIGDQIAVGDTVLEVFDASLYKSDLEIPGYKILEGIGKGGMGTVYKAKHLPMDRIVALKVLNKRYSQDPDFIDRFIREARAAGQLNHPNVIQVHDVSKVNDLYFFSMEFIDGPSVKELLKKSGRLEVSKGLDIALQAAKALEYAHSKGIIHRDIKPDNLMVTRDGVLKIADLGIAKNFDDKKELAKGHVLGTPHYMAPEQALGREIDQRVDIYSLGAAFYHMLTGQTPFTGDTAQSVIRAHLQEQLPAIQEFNPDVPDPVCFIVERMMAKSPEKRYENMTRVIADIEKARGGVGAEIERIQIEDSQIMQAVRPAEKRTWHKKKAIKEAQEEEEKTDQHKKVGMSGVKVAILAGGAVLILGIAALWALIHFKEQPQPEKIPTPPDHADLPGPVKPDPTKDPVKDPAKDPATIRQEAFKVLETEYNGKASTGEADLEKRLNDFADKNPNTPEASDARKYADQSRNTRAGAEFKDLQGQNLSGQPLISALDGFIKKFPGAAAVAPAQKMRDDELKALSSQQSTAWSADYRQMDEAYRALATENFDQRLKTLNDFMAKIKTQAGNPNIAVVQKEITAVQEDAALRIKNALESADNALKFNQYAQAILEMTKYKQRFRDTANAPQADAKISEAIDKARALLAAAKTKALDHIKTDVGSVRAKREFEDIIGQVKGVGTLGEDAQAAEKDLECFDRLHLACTQKSVLENISERPLPKPLQLPGKRDLGLVNVTDKQLQLSEGSSSAVIPKKWEDLTIAERLEIYAYLLKPKEGPIPPELQADLDKAKALMGP